MKLNFFAVLLSVGAMSASAAASIESITLDLKGREWTGPNQVQLKDELKAQHPEINIDELSLVGLEVSGSIDGQVYNKVPMPLANEASELSMDPWILNTEGQVALTEIVMKVEPVKSGNGEFIIRRDSGSNDGYGRRYYTPRRGYYPGNGAIIISPGRGHRDDWRRDGRRDDWRRDHDRRDGWRRDNDRRDGWDRGDRRDGRPGDRGCAPGFPCRRPNVFMD